MGEEKKDEAVKVSALELRNFKRVRAVQLSPAPDGLTVIGGANRQGKTSVLDAIEWALGGDRHRPDSPNREGAATKARLKVALSNGIVVERRGKNGDLKVTDSMGQRAGQQLLNEFLEELALDLPRFLSATDKEKAETLLRIIGVGDELARLDSAIASRYQERTALGRDAERKRKAAEDMESFEDAPAEPVSVAELVRRQQDILARNGENQRKRMEADQIKAEARVIRGDLENASVRLDELERQTATAKAEYERLIAATRMAEIEAENAAKTAQQLEDESTEEIEASIAEIELTNEHVRSNQAKAAAIAEAERLEGEYAALTGEIERLRDERTGLLDGADLPLPGLSVDDGVLVYEGRTWDDMSGSDQLKVATAIVRAVKPSCGFVLVDKLEQMDRATLAEFASWAETEGLQVIGTRVSDGDECTVVIEDGRVKGAPEEPDAEPSDAVGWDGEAEQERDYGEEW